MLKESWIVYKDGTVKTEIISLKDGEVFSVNPQQDNIQHAGIRTFKYRVNPAFNPGSSCHGI